MSNDVYCNCNTVNIVNTAYKRENNIGTEVKWIMLMMLMIKLRILNFKHLVLIGGKILFTPALKLNEILFTQLFMAENSFYPTHFSSVPTPL